MTWLINFIEYGTVFLSIWTLVVITNEVLREFQQHRYQLSKVLKVLKYFYVQDRTQLLFPLCIAIFFLDRWYVQLVFSGYLGFLIIWKWLQKSEPTEPYGGRLQRLFFLMIIIDTVIATLLHYYLPLSHIFASLTILMLFAPFFVFIGATLLLPWELMGKKWQLRKRD
ncbi:MAG: hypothetical protein AB7V00_04600 [Bacilli bacterium]